MPYEAYFRAATESLIIVDRSGRIVEANLSTQKLFGYEPEELAAQSVELLLPKSLRERHRDHVRGYFAAPRTRASGRGLNLVGRRKDGSEFPVEVSLTYAPGTRLGDVVIASVVDITERLELESEARMVEGTASLGTLAAGIAHDVNNPLQVIRSRTELLLELPGETLASEMREDLATINRQAQRASRILEEFLGLSKQRDRTFAPIDIDQLVERALLLLSGQMRRDGIGIETTISANLPTVMGDVTSLERVLINLLANARDATPRDGLITITGGTTDEQPPWVHLSVKDSGLGIPPDAVGRIFDLFYSTKARGTGLGLWMSRRIVQEHNGKLEVESQLGKGATFTIRLPPR